ncbi:hypothetical protein HD842_002753 [Massilia aurea]|uniref:Uncharacterized protein n=1 Tax=Massilia aurea TaxID=373040 RepID=A0A7W9X185_9BURK|nr:hypothetical protein [Massilia aurea]
MQCINQTQINVIVPQDKFLKINKIDTANLYLHYFLVFYFL